MVALYVDRRANSFSSRTVHGKGYLVGEQRLQRVVSRRGALVVGQRASGRAAARQPVRRRQQQRVAGAAARRRAARRRHVRRQRPHRAASAT